MIFPEKGSWSEIFEIFKSFQSGFGFFQFFSFFIFLGEEGHFFALFCKSCSFFRSFMSVIFSPEKGSGEGEGVCQTFISFKSFISF